MLQSATTMESNTENPVCVLADLPGSGKTYVLLALIQERTLTNETNIVIVPQNIYTQWVQSITAWGAGISYKSYMNYSEITELYFNPRFTDPPPILLTTPVYFGIISDSLAAAKVTVRRVIIDEIDSVAGLLQKRIACKTLWMVSASFTAGCLAGTPYNGAHPPMTRCTREFVENGFPLPAIMRNELICQNFYIGLLVGLLEHREMQQVNALDFSNLSISSRANVVTAKNVLEFFVADLKDTIASCERKIKDSEKSIKECRWQRELFESAINYVLELQTPSIHAIVNNCSPNQAQGLLLILDRFGFINVNDMLVKTPDATVNLSEFKDFAGKLIKTIGLSSLEQELNTTTKELATATTKYNNIYERLTEANACLICYESFASDSDGECNKSVSKCCSNSFCTECILGWAKTSRSCPMCRHGSLVLVMEAKDAGVTPVLKQEHGPNDKMTVLSNLFTDNVLGDKVIIFNNYPAVFLEIKKYLNSQGISWTELDGGNIKAIDHNLAQYKSGPTRVLLTNSSFYGCGINLENTSDVVIMHKCNAQRMTAQGMEEQIIGRAQRPGRTTALRVWMLLHENECPPAALFHPIPAQAAYNDSGMEGAGADAIGLNSATSLVSVYATT